MQRSSNIPLAQRLISILWPSFLVAGVATVLFFTAFDPLHLLECADTIENCRLTAYTLGFFLFWILTAGSSMLTCYFQRPCGPGNDR